ncbi:MAG: hypothetical protein WA057_05215 [Candidatus Magasanikiibacteriota bacterium]
MSEFPLIIKGGRLVKLAGYHSPVEGAAQEQLVMPLDEGEKTTILAKLAEQNEGQTFTFSQKNELCDGDGNPLDEQAVNRLLTTIHLE